MNCMKGIFWLSEAELITRKIACDTDGKPLDESCSCTAKNGNGDNHRIVWSMLPHSVTHGKPYNYYPRGRVEIRRGRATVYLNPSLCTDEFKDRIKKEFHLNPDCKIQQVIFKADGSRHYRCSEDK